MRKCALASGEAPIRIVSRGLTNVASEFSNLLPKISTITRSICHLRQGKETHDLIRLDETVDGRPFLCANDEHIQVYASDVDIEWLSRCPNWFADGTFKTVPKEFDQLYSIHGNDGQTTKPCVFALMRGRSETAYRHLLNTLHVLFPQLSPQHVTLDFEIATISAFRHIFLSIVVSGCSFHFNQSIWRAIQRNSLAAQYRSEPLLRAQVARIFAMPYVPTEFVFQAFVAFKENADARLVEVIKYFEHMYLGVHHVRRNSEPVYSHEFWNLYQQTVCRIP
jgi:hypothetical protein